MTKVESIEHLKTLTDQDGQDFFLCLNGGFRSSKRIWYYDADNSFVVYNEIDDSYQEDLTEEQLATETNIVDGIEKGAFYAYEY